MTKPILDDSSLPKILAEIERFKTRATEAEKDLGQARAEAAQLREALARTWDKDWWTKHEGVPQAVADRLAMWQVWSGAALSTSYGKDALEAVRMAHDCLTDRIDRALSTVHEEHALAAIEKAFPGLGAG